ncbi:hypothetical protein [Flavobacterium sp.]
MNSVLKTQWNGAVLRKTNTKQVEIATCSSCIPNGFDVKHVTPYNSMLHNKG